MPRNNSTIMASNNNSSYMAMTGSGAVKRIRTPTATDVLLGRGGGINSHVGNKVFRDWVRDRKEDYNLAGSKVEKTRVAKEVMGLVQAQSPPGRFLQKDPTGGVNGCWVEVDELRALAKTSQALREGAPQIRASHQGKEPAKRKRKNVTTSSRIKPVVPSSKRAERRPSVPVVWPQTVPSQPTSNANPNEAITAAATTQQDATASRAATQHALNELNRNLLEAKSLANLPHPGSPTQLFRPLMSNSEFRQHQQEQQELAEVEPVIFKRPRLDSTVSDVPPIPPPDIPAHRSFGGSGSSSSGSQHKNNKDFARAHSLALSDVDAWINGPGDPQDDFVNPFLNEDFEVGLPTSTTPESPRGSNSNFRTMVRNVSSDEGREEYRRLGEMYALPPPPLPAAAAAEQNHHHYYQPHQYRLRSYSDTADFHDELRNVMDEVHAAEDDLTSPTLEGKGGDENSNHMPTLLLPWRGGALQRRYGSNGALKNGNGTPRSISISDILNERQ